MSKLSKLKQQLEQWEKEGYDVSALKAKWYKELYERHTLRNRLIVTISSVVVLIILAGVVVIAVGGVFESNPEAAYNSVHDDIQNAVAGYASDHMGELPYMSGTSSISSCSNCHIIDMNALLTSNSGMLISVPDGTYSAFGENNDNCDNGATGCSGNSHYIWIIDSIGNIYSQCIGIDCDNNNATGYQGIWP